ncbi:DNA mismatch repair endonuclease MutL [Psychrobacter sp. I-STPA6b]|uniref:DNA mismatch repair endonuclease MutL n=1 Tax=Psychrobacter sp. I-STPA6b TaxID=2585718 RepID=UPI001D0C6B01|nr:DNA mismatch repair endonuclease MutL [Psychrobacter sp. I-STPA6b]
MPIFSSDSARIKKLPPLLINQLAAGEIVTRPASVVKELMENAIDAGATEIEIKVTQGGMAQIEVRDNGCGIHPDDMVMAVTRHATSKIADVAHLHGIQTLGFRGEALASTAAVSRLTLSSCHDDSGIGRQLSVVGVIHDEPLVSPILHTQGTTVSVKDLYFNVPARRANLKSIATEFAHIETVVRELALAVSQVTVSLWHDGKRRLHLPAITADMDESASTLFTSDMATIEGVSCGSGIAQILSRLKTIFAREFAHDLEPLPLQVDLSGLIKDIEEQLQQSSQVGITGTLLLPDIFSQYSSQRAMKAESENIQSDRAKIDLPKLIYINGRLVKDTRIAQTIRDGIRQALPARVQASHTQVGYVLFFTLPQNWLNVNVHPSKQRISIHTLPNVLAHLEVMVTSRLQAWYERIQQQSPKLVIQPENTRQSNDTHIHQVNEPKQAYHCVSNTVQPFVQNDDSNDIQDVKVNGRVNCSVPSGSILDNSSRTRLPLIPQCLLFMAQEQYPQLLADGVIIQHQQGMSLIDYNELVSFLQSFQSDISSMFQSDISSMFQDNIDMSAPDAMSQINQSFYEFFSCPESISSNSERIQSWQDFIQNQSLATINYGQLAQILTAMIDSANANE